MTVVCFQGQYCMCSVVLLGFPVVSVVWYSSKPSALYNLLIFAKTETLHSWKRGKNRYLWSLFKYIAALLGHHQYVVL